MINVCVPVLSRYDLLRDLLLSLCFSTVSPRVYIIDNGRNAARIDEATRDFMVSIHRPDRPMGVAESWNYFLANVPEERVITNDDITFSADSLERLAASKADLVWACGFSCFLIRDTCVKKLGVFDESISPGYGYYEDEDYLQRLDGRGTRAASAVAENVECGVRHVHSATLKAETPEGLEEHHRKFKIAQNNYARKWRVQF